MTQTLPTRHIAGDSFSWRRAVAAYPASAGWVLKARFVSRTAGGVAVAYTGTADGDVHVLALTATQTATWTVGGATLVLWLERGADVYTVDQIQLDVLASLRDATAGVDARSLAQRTVDDLKAAFAQWSSSGGTVRRYKIVEREMEFNASAEIIKQIEYWEGQVAKELDAARLAAGGRPRNRILVRFARPR